MNFDVTNGNPTPEEFAALQAVMALHIREELKPVLARSVYGLPQLRQPMAHQINFSIRKST